VLLVLAFSTQKESDTERRELSSFNKIYNLQLHSQQHTLNRVPSSFRPVTSQPSYEHPLLLKSFLFQPLQQSYGLILLLQSATLHYLLPY